MADRRNVVLDRLRAASDWLDSWRMCRTMCHEHGSLCSFPLSWAWSRIRRSRKRKVVYSQQFVSQVLDMQWRESDG